MTHDNQESLENQDLPLAPTIAQEEGNLINTFAPEPENAEESPVAEAEAPAIPPTVEESPLPETEPMQAAFQAEEPASPIAQPEEEEANEPVISSSEARPSGEMLAESPEVAEESEALLPPNTPSDISAPKEVSNPGNVTTTETQEEHEEEEHAEDFSNYSKEEFLELIQRLAQQEDLRRFNPLLREIKPLFDEIVEAERTQARQQFVEAGGEEDGFEFKEDEITQAFYALYQQLHKKRAEQIARNEQQKEANLKKKNDILDQLRKLIETEENGMASFDEFKKLQEEWKQIGPVHPQHNRNLWASYSALVDRFYDQRSIYFELKELDRKKNLAQKEMICARAEKLIEMETINEAIKELNDLHEEFKHIGPVPKEDKEAIWQRFKAASDRIYDKKREYLRKLEEEKQRNLEAKIILCEVIEPFKDFQSDRIKEWNAKTKEIIEIQKKWDEIKMIPREKIKEVSRRFWTPFKIFFNNKNTFIRTLDQEREENLRLKTVLCEEADQLIASSKGAKEIAEGLKDLQIRWKEIGPVPPRFRQSIYDRFKSTCDSFFEQRRKNYANQEREYEENLQKKIALCEKIEQAQPQAEIAEAEATSFIHEWQNLGFVPRKDKGKLQDRFEEAIDKFIDRMPIKNDVEREKIRLTIQGLLAKDSPNAKKKVTLREGGLRRRITELENDINILKNNIGFLASSKKADKLKDSLNQQIQDASQELKTLRAQLKAMRELQN
ncbi:MAG: DUF349 domain-containing protein [Microscillaceae bacterium]|nr:DUF349 domain-containing protein [Microscillaceae bacterium]